jgi:hypothetical protein
MRSRFIWFLVFTLTGYSALSAASGFNAYVGRPVSELALQIGPPTSISDGPDGSLVFKWNRFGPSDQRIGASSSWTPTPWLELSLWFTGRCVLRVEARPARSDPRPVPADWIMENWRFVGWSCI